MNGSNNLDWKVPYSENGTQLHSDPQSDSIWILSSTFIIFTMQSGFGLLESGSVSMKNEVNIMVKNAVDVIFGGLTYWMFGYGFSFGEMEPYVNKFCGWGDFFVNSQDTEEKIGWIYSKFFFQASFATTATTIVSGGMAERTKLESYIIFSFLNTFVFCFPAHWMWGTKGWLMDMGAVDIAGAGPVHLVGGVTAFVATVMLKPRHGRYESKNPPVMGSPTNAILGMFMLWWGWLGFNCGSTFGISGQKWKLAARSAVSTLCASMGGGFMGIVLSYLLKKRRFDVTYMINGVLGSLVGITAFCALAQPWEGIVIGAVGGLITNAGVELLDRLKVDDPVGCVGTHALSGMWSLLAVGFFARKDMLAEALAISSDHAGLFQGGGFYLLGVQALAVVTLTVWTLIVSFVILKAIDMTLGLRIPLQEELLGADIVEHGIGGGFYDKVSGKFECRDDGISDEEMAMAVVNGSRRRRLSLGKRHARKGSQISCDDFERDEKDFEREGDYNSNQRQDISPKHTQTACCGCFFSHLRRKKRLTIPPRNVGLSPKIHHRRYKRSQQHRHKSSNHSPSAKERERTDHLHAKYGISNISMNGHIRNGYANVGYGLSPDSANDLQSELTSNGIDHGNSPTEQDGAPEYEMTYI